MELENMTQINNKNYLINNNVNENTALVVPDVIDKVKFVNTPNKNSIKSSSSSSSSSYLSRAKPKPKIPDGGWGWMVVLASLVISMIADGISLSFGLVYVEFLNEYNESKSKTAWIGSLFMAVPLLSGPIMSALVDRYGCRKMTILGGIISGTGFVLSSQANTLEMQLFTFGILSGLGLGLCYVTAVVSIAYWFDKKRSFATSLGACGTGIGTLVYAPLTQYFLDEYGWRGAILLLAGTLFNFCVCGTVMRDPDWWVLEQSKLQKKKSTSSITSISCARSEGGESNFPGVEEIRKLMKSGETAEYILTALTTSMGNDAAKTDNNSENDCEKGVVPKYSSVVNLPTFIKQSEIVPIEVLETLSSNKKLYNVILENYPALLLCRSTSDKGLNIIHEIEQPTRIPVTMSMRLKKHDEDNKQHSIENNEKNDTITPLLSELKIIKNPPKIIKKQTNYLQNIKMHRNSVMYRGAILNINKYRLRASSCPDIYRNSMITLAKDEEEDYWYTELVDMLKAIMDFSMFLEWHFFCLSMSTTLLFIWFIVPYFYLAEHLARKGYTLNQSSQLLSVIGLANAIGMVGLGWAGDQPWIDVPKTFAVCLFLCGFSTAGLALFTDYPYLLLFTSIIFGLSFASSFSFTPVVLAQLIPLERFTTGYGLILLCQGIGNLLGPPIAGLIFDLIGSWDVSFYLASFWIIISGVFVGIISYTKNRLMIGEGELEKDSDRLSTNC